MANKNCISVTILMPVYKVEKYLTRTLASIFTQTYENINYVFVDDCSPDESLRVLKMAITAHNIDNSRYTIICHPQNEGIAVSRADCIAHATGDYVLFVDSDDWIEPTMVEQLIDATEDGTIDIVGCDYAKDFLRGNTTVHHENYSIDCRENMVRCINYDISTTLWKLLVRRSLFENIKITPHVDIVEDYIISTKLYYFARSFRAVNKPLYHYVQYNMERVSLQTLRSITMHIKGVKEVEAFLEEHGLIDDDIRQRLLLRKFNIKSNFLTRELLDYEAYRTTFPEADSVWRQMGYSRNEKIKFWLAEKNLYWLLKIIQR